LKIVAENKKINFFFFQNTLCQLFQNTYFTLTNENGWIPIWNVHVEKTIFSALLFLADKIINIIEDFFSLLSSLVCGGGGVVGHSLNLA
jgi:hypothetical protein